MACSALVRRVAAGAIVAVAVCLTADAENRFPRPEFDSGHLTPAPTTPGARALVLEYVDVAVLAVLLALASWFAVSRRSRRGLLLLTLFSVVYFGFWKRGCVCPVGATQNVTLAFSDGSYAIPLPVLAFFLLPLVFTLFFGRTFCAAVCPLGAIQDLCILKPLRLPRWLSHTLGLLPFVYLALAVLFAAAGGAFVICRYDPFIGFFRLGGPASMLATGAALLVLGTVVARPYCRFLCPYGALLKVASWMSRRHLSITPTVCVDCRLCRSSCPFDAIRWPTAANAEPRSPAEDRRRFVAFLVVLPLAVGLGAWGGVRVAPALARYQPEVRTAQALVRESAGERVPTSLETDSFREGPRSTADLLAAARRTERRFVAGSGVAGGFLAAVVVLKLLSLSTRRTLKDHVADRADCLSCGRCFASCPVGRSVDQAKLADVPPLQLRRPDGVG